jgi:hypothetical protein
MQKYSIVCLYGCEFWSIMVKEEYWQCVFENKLLREIFGPNVAEVSK